MKTPVEQLNKSTTATDLLIIDMFRDTSWSEIFKMMKDNDIQREDMPQLRKERERKKETLLNFRTGKCLSLNT